MQRQYSINHSSNRSESGLVVWLTCLLRMFHVLCLIPQHHKEKQLNNNKANASLLSSEDKETI